MKLYVTTRLVKGHEPVFTLGKKSDLSVSFTNTVLSVHLRYVVGVGFKQEI